MTAAASNLIEYSDDRLGLDGMRERVELHDGRLTVETPGSGQPLVRRGAAVITSRARRRSRRRPIGAAVAARREEDIEVVGEAGMPRTRSSAPAP